MKNAVSLKEALSDLNNSQKERFTHHKNSLEIFKGRTEFFDNLIKKSLVKLTEFKAQSDVFVAAVGGYGRKELYPKSDIDLVIVHRKCSEKLLDKIYETVVIPLIDAKTEVGYSFRYYREMPRNIETELTNITSLLDLRFLWGDYDLFDYFREGIFFHFLKKIRKPYLKLKMAEYEKRLEKYNDSPYILEPNIKEGIGGLRDFHYISWLSKVLFTVSDLDALTYIGFLTEKDMKTLREAYLFLSKVRIYTHFYHYLQKEKLSFDLQDEVATFLGYQDSTSALRVEQFMSDYYRYTHNVYLITSKFLHNVNIALKKKGNFVRQEIDRGIYIEGFGGGEINLLPAVIKNNNRLLLKCFYYSKEWKKRLSYKTINLIQSYAQQNKGWEWDEELKNLFFKVISPQESYVKELLKDMYNSDFFQILFPEFRNIHHKMQFDAYHIFTIDMHTIIAMSKLADLYVKNVDDIRSKIKKPHLLAFAVFLHDLGKGEGKNHAQKGGLIAEEIAKRMDLDFKERELIVFLVKNHLLLSHIAQRRDISDYKFLKKVYREVIKTKENLNHLYFLTIVDLMAVGEGVWSEWKSRLLKNLVVNFEKVMVSEKDFTEEEVKAKKKELKERILKINKKELSPMIECLSDNCVLKTEIDELIKYLELNRELMASSKPFVFKVIPHDRERFFEVLVATKDVKGLFSQLAGSFTLAGFNILGANINTLENGNVIDVFMVDLGKRDYEYDKVMFENLVKHLSQVIEGKKPIGKEVLERARRYHKKSAFKEKNDVYFDNISSDKYTIIEVYAQDHMGLLFEITSTLSALDLNIHFSRISTMGDRAVDVFYISRNNAKITDEKELEMIKSTILKNINL